MAAIDELLTQIEDENLRTRILAEVGRLRDNKQFGLVWERHLPENAFLPGFRISPGATVALRDGSTKKDKTMTALSVDAKKGTAVCRHEVKEQDGNVAVKETTFALADLVAVARCGEPIFPTLRPIDKVVGAPDSALWHSLIQADNYHALQLLAYLYPGQVDCIYIDPPYNTGARDWKYNNDYVDDNDKYRHSKWLSMMESRLLLAKKLLNPANSVLIVTIDEKEYLHLGCLLEKMFPEANMQMISSNIAQKGVARKNSFYRVNEYIYIIQFGLSSVAPLILSDEWQFGKGDSAASKGIVWSQLRRSGTNDLRSDRENLFYPPQIRS